MFEHLDTANDCIVAFNRPYHSAYSFNMSYMMEFPPSKAKMPQGQGPPHVRFAINDVETTNELPTNIPAALVFHFAPALRKWVLPETKPGPGLVNQALLSPFVAINITEDIEVEGLGW